MIGIRDDRSADPLLFIHFAAGPTPADAGPFNRDDATHRLDMDPGYRPAIGEVDFTAII